MKTIRIKVPNKSYDKEMEVLDAVSALLNKLGKDKNIEIQQGQGGTLDDWKEVDFGNKDGRLMVFKVSAKGEELIKEVKREIRGAKRSYNQVIALEEQKIPSGFAYLFAKMQLDRAKRLLAQAK